MTIKKSFTFEYDFGDLVKLKTDPDRIEGIITKYIIEPNGAKTYEMSVGVEKSWHGAIELVRVNKPSTKVDPAKAVIKGLGAK
jgi:hypothetical protein